MNTEAMLDHVGIAVADLARGRATFEHLGFKLTSRSDHAGARTPGGPVEPWGSGNHCAMFESGYLEILGITDPQKFSNAQDMVARYEGAHIVALGCASADAACAALRGRGITVTAPQRLERKAAFGEHDEQRRLAAFRNLYLERTAYPEARFLYIEHLTREVLWQPHLLTQPNGVCAIREVTLCAADAGGAAARVGRIAGSEPVAEGEGEDVWRLPLRHSALRVVSPQAWRQQRLGAPLPLPPLPAPVEIAFAVRELTQTQAFFTQRNVPTTMDAHGRLWLAPSLACGAALSFFAD